MLFIYIILALATRSRVPGGAVIFDRAVLLINVLYVKVKPQQLPVLTTKLSLLQDDVDVGDVGDPQSAQHATTGTPSNPAANPNIHQQHHVTNTRCPDVDDLLQPTMTTPGRL